MLLRFFCFQSELASQLGDFVFEKCLKITCLHFLVGGGVDSHHGEMVEEEESERDTHDRAEQRDENEHGFGQEQVLENDYVAAAGDLSGDGVSSMDGWAQKCPT